MPAVITESNVRVENQSLGLGGPRPEIGLYEIIGKSESFYPLRRHPLIEPDNVNLGSFFMTAKNRDMFFSEKPPIIGRIEYEDSIGNRYEFGFAFQPASVWGHPINATNRFIRWGGAQYNFDRPIEATPKSER
jgi:hypothetical protein